MSGWLREHFGAGRTPVASARWLVVDCETTGLDPTRDRLLSVAAIAVRDGRISLEDAFSATLRQEQPSTHENIVVHGIGRERQAGGEDAAAVLAAFLSFAGEAPRVAWRAAFDKAVLVRAARAAGRRERGLWLDLAGLMPVLFPRRGSVEAPLEAWLDAFAIAHPARHDALADAYASAQLLQVGLSEAARQGFRTVGAVLRAARSGRWTGG